MKLLGEEGLGRYQIESDALNKKLEDVNLRIEKQEKRHRKTSKVDEVLSSYKKVKYEIGQNIKRLDEQYGNSWFTRVYEGGLRGRMIIERKWMSGIAKALEFQSPADFAILMGETIDGIYHKEVDLSDPKKDKYFGMEVPKEAKNAAQAKVEEVRGSVNKWYEEHESEQPYKTLAQFRSSKREDTLIKAFRDMAGSYSRRKEEGDSDEQQLVVIKQMEVILNLLAKKENPKHAINNVGAE